jgi:hypothetical protein
MSHKLMSFLGMSWFISAMICIIMDGTTSNSNMGNILNELIPLTTINVAGFFTLPALNLDFFKGFMRLILWDYSFYYGGYVYIRYFWMALLSPGAAFAVAQTFVWVYASFIKPF